MTKNTASDQLTFWPNGVALPIKQQNNIHKLYQGISDNFFIYLFSDNSNNAFEECSIEAKEGSTT